ncbi:hypothetical protein Pelo_13902 [Pelomyxa schiedti]|nr:hypothetical protein Pelo_13902 [Pelomyxa schiedti]
MYGVLLRNTNRKSPKRKRRFPGGEWQGFVVWNNWQMQLVLKYYHRNLNGCIRSPSIVSAHYKLASLG